MLPRAQALSTNIASDGMESARRACGGHGYSLLSGLPTVFTTYVQNVTWEGDNNVMLLQVRAPPDCHMPMPAPCAVHALVGSLHARTVVAQQQASPPVTTACTQTLCETGGHAILLRQCCSAPRRRRATS